MTPKIVLVAYENCAAHTGLHMPCTLCPGRFVRVDRNCACLARSGPQATPPVDGMFGFLSGIFSDVGLGARSRFARLGRIAGGSEEGAVISCRRKKHAMRFSVYRP